MSSANFLLLPINQGDEGMVRRRVVGNQKLDCPKLRGRSLICVPVFILAICGGDAVEGGAGLIGSKLDNGNREVESEHPEICCAKLSSSHCSDLEPEASPASRQLIGP
jgi:hypothetical protein